MTHYYKLTFTPSEHAISEEEAKYWIKQFQANTKIGVEIETEFRNNSTEVLEKMKDFLEPTRNNSTFGKYGAHSVIYDGSLSNGLEIPMIGRRFEYNDSREKLKAVLDKLKEVADPFLHQRAGLHNHILLSYQGRNNSELERSVPGIILINFLQLVRRMAPELVFITSSNYKQDGDSVHFTRMENFRKFDRLMSTTPLKEGRTFLDYVRLASSGSYPAIRTSYLQFEDEYNIKQFHIELRFPDASLYEDQIVNLQVLYMAMFQKAIEISKYGILEMGEGFEETKDLMNTIFMRALQNRLSNSVDMETIETLQERTTNMIKFFSGNITRIEELALEPLMKLAKEPISIYRAKYKLDGVVAQRQSKGIERHVTTKEPSKRKYDNAIERIIDTMEIIDCKSKKEWEEKLGEALDISYKMANHYTWKFSQHTPITFDKMLGTVVKA